MADFLSDDKQPDAPGTETPSDSRRLDRRSFLRALSGSALTVVAGGLTVTLAACQGASTSSPLIASTGVTATPVSLTPASSISGQSLNSFSINSSGVSLGGSASLISNSANSSGSNSSNSSNSNSSNSNSSSSNSNSSSSNSSSSSSSSSSSLGTLVRRQAMASLQPRDFVPDGWSTRA